MTGRTHDLAAFTGLSVYFVIFPLVNMSLATLITVLAANFIGGLFPDIDQSTGTLWRRLRGGSFLGKLISPLLGGHRLFTHSIIGLVATGYLLKWFLEILHTVLLVDMNVVWWAFMIGFVTHLFMDMLTRDGVPLLFPIPIKFGIPPIKTMRPKTGGFFEKVIMFPSLLGINAFLIYTNYEKFLTFLKIFVTFK